jgi:hypothetical protein
MKCPKCHKLQTHGYCNTCYTYCGCSFDPTSMSDYCYFHKPGNKRKNDLTIKEARGIIERMNNYSHPAFESAVITLLTNLLDRVNKLENRPR